MKKQREKSILRTNPRLNVDIKEIRSKTKLSRSVTVCVAETEKGVVKRSFLLSIFVLSFIAFSARRVKHLGDSMKVFNVFEVFWFMYDRNSKRCGHYREIK